MSRPAERWFVTGAAKGLQGWMYGHVTFGDVMRT
jgi:hypothetical protein